MRVLLNKKSEEAIKSLKDVQVLKYSSKDFRLLKDMVNDEKIIQDTKDRFEQAIYLYILNACCESSAKQVYLQLYDTLYTKGGVYKKAFDLIFSSNISQVPLLINEPYLRFIAKWRLLINK